MYHRSPVGGGGGGGGQNSRIQRRSVLYISEPVPQLPVPNSTPKEQEPLVSSESPRPKMTSAHKPPVSMVIWLGGALLVFWLVILTLFFMFHILHTSPSQKLRTQEDAAATNRITFVLPSNLSYTIPPLRAANLTDYRICCWHPTEQTLHCNLAGVVWDGAHRQILFGPVHAHLIGGQCTFHSTNSRTF